MYLYLIALQGKFCRTTSMGIVGSSQKSGNSFLWAEMFNIRQCDLKLLAKRYGSAIAKGLADFVR